MKTCDSDKSRREGELISSCICGTDVPLHNGSGRRRKYCSESCKQRAKRVRASAKRVMLERSQRSKLYIVPLDLKQANAFVTEHHRHNKAVPGAKLCLGVVDEVGVLRGAAIVGRPIARLLDDTLTLEVNRVATDGCPNACSALYGTARRTAFAMGYRRLVTYTLQSESGASLRGAGWKRVAETKAMPHGWLNREGRAKQAVSELPKWRWETLNPEYRQRRPTFHGRSSVSRPATRLPSCECFTENQGGTNEICTSS